MNRRGHKTGTIDVVSKALQEVGPMTLAEMMDYTGLSKQSASKALRDLNREMLRTPKRAHITQWVYDHEGQKRYPRAVYAWGNCAGQEGNPEALKVKEATALSSQQCVQPWPSVTWRLHQKEERS